MFARASLTTLAAGVLVLAGCAGKLDEKKSFTLDPKDADVKTFTLPAQPAEQTLTVEVKASGEVDVFIATSANASDIQGGVSFKKRAEKALAAKEKVKTDTVTATIPPKTEVTVIVALAGLGGEPAQVDLRMTNKK